MRAELSVKFVELRHLFKHVPVEPRLQLEGNLRAVLNQIDKAMDWKAPVPKPAE